MRISWYSAKVSLLVMFALSPRRSALCRTRTQAAASPQRPSSFRMLVVCENEVKERVLWM